MKDVTELDGVRVCKLGKIVEFKNGLNFRAQGHSHPIRILGVGDFLDRTKLNDLSSLKDVFIDRPARPDELLRDGDLVFVRSNGKKELVGRCMQVYPGDMAVSYSGFTIRGRVISDKVNSDYIALLMSGGLLKEALKREGAGTNISNLNQKILSGLDIPLPSLDRQKEVVATFANWEDVIDKLSRLYDLKDRYYRSIAAKLITKTKVAHKVGDVASEVSTRNSADQHTRVLSVTNRKGFVLAENQFERRVASADVSSYKIVSNGQYAYNPSRINVGSIARLDDWDHGILSPMYVVFRLDTSRINSDYFLHWLSTYEAKQRIRLAAQGSVRETVSFKDFSEIEIPLPDIGRQEKIAGLLSLMQQETKLLSHLRNKYKTQKHQLLQELIEGKLYSGDH